MIIIPSDVHNIPYYLSYKLCVHVIHFRYLPVVTGSNIITYVGNVILTKMSIVICLYLYTIIVTLTHRGGSSLFAFRIKLNLPLLLSEDPGSLHACSFTQSVPAGLAVLPCLEGHLALSLLHTEVGSIVARLY